MKLILLLALIAVISAAVPAFAQSRAYTANRSFVVIPLYHMSPALIAQILGGQVIYDMPGGYGGGGYGGGGYDTTGPGMRGGYGTGYNAGGGAGFGAPPGRRNDW